MNKEAKDINFRTPNTRKIETVKLGLGFLNIHKHPEKWNIKRDILLLIPENNKVKVYQAAIKI